MVSTFSLIEIDESIDFFYNLITFVIVFKCNTIFGNRRTDIKLSEVSFGSIDNNQLFSRFKMNLMDMLSGDAPSTMFGDDLNGHCSLDVEMEEEIDDNGKVYYLPTQLCRIQIELLDLIIQMFKNELILEIKNRKKRVSIASLLESETRDFRNYDKVELLFNQIMIVDKHPSLIVDHFIPKKLILLEINDRLLSLSGKIKLLNQIIDSLIINEKSSQGYHVLIVAQSVRELELIEGSIIGKDLYYANRSNSKLYDDERVPTNYDSRLCVYLITSSQLYNNYIPAPVPGVDQFNSIISFDLNLDTSNPSVQLIRQQKQIPIMIPLPLYSIEHIVLQLPPPQSGFNSKEYNDPLYHWRIKAIHCLIMNRDKLINSQDDFFVENYGPSMVKFIDWVYNNKPFPIKLKTFNDNLILRFKDEEILAQIENLYNQDFVQLKQFDYETYKSTLAEILNYKLNQLQKSIQVKVDIELPELRLQQTNLQINHDSNEDLIAEKFNRLKRLNEDASLSEKKLARTENYLIQYQSSNQELEDNLKYLYLVKESGEYKFEEQMKVLETLKAELTNLTTEFDRLNEEYEESKLKYQTSSSEAIQLSNKVQKLTHRNEKLEKQINGPGMVSLPQLIQSDIELSYETKLKKLEQENKFLLSFFNEKIEKLANERHQIIDSMGSGSTSRPTNRISRAATPF